jgi:hypothetical protein
MHLFPVEGVPPRIYFPWKGSPPSRQLEDFFFVTLGLAPDEEMVGDRLLMKKWLETVKSDNRGGRV